jgi:hypothetical protein
MGSGQRVLGKSTEQTVNMVSGLSGRSYETLVTLRLLKLEEKRHHEDMDNGAQIRKWL